MGSNTIERKLETASFGTSGRFLQTSAGYSLGFGTTNGDYTGNGTADEGWAPGALFLHTDGTGVDDSVYVNTGTKTAAVWTSFASVAGADFGATGILADVIAESSGDTGVTVDGLLAKDGGITSTIPNVYDANTTITAGTTQTQAGATALTGEFNNVTTVGTAGDGVKLPTAAAGLKVTVKNSGAQILRVWPASADSINALAVDLSVDLGVGESMTFRAISATVWESERDVSLSVLAPTTLRGALRLIAADNAGNTNVDIKNASHGQATVVTIPDSGLSTAYMVQSTAAITAVEADVLDGAVAANSVAAKAALLDSSKRIQTAASIGTPGTGTTAVEYGDGRTHQTVLTLAAVLPTIGGGADLAVGVLIYTLPAGAVIIESAYMSVAISGATEIQADTPDVGLGTTIATGVVNVLGGTAAFENIITGQAAANCNGTATVKTAIPTAAVPLVIEAAGNHTVHFNAADGWAAIGDGSADVTGTVVLNWRFMA